MPKLWELFQLAIDLWIKSDIRGEKKIFDFLNEQKDKYKKLDKEKKAYFDQDIFTNPYYDSKIYYGQLDTKIKKIIVWIDVEWQEILTVNEYNKKNPKNKIDAILWHHPEWKALVDLWWMLKTVLNEIEFNLWLPVNQVEKINEPRIWKINRSISPLNYNRHISIAKILWIPFFWIHTPADNLCCKYLNDLFSKNNKKIKKLKDIINLLEKIPEMQISKLNWVWPQIWSWNEESLVWKIAVNWITWWTSWAKEMFEKYSIAWIWTVIAMHIWEDHLEEAKKHNINVIMTDHMASDSLGLNLIADEYQKLWVEILDFSWFIRVSRI